MCVPSQHPRLFVFSGGHDGLRQHAQCEDPHLRLQQARPGCLLGRGDRAHPNLAFMCEYTSEPTRDVALYNCDYSPHYDLLTPLDSRLALEGSYHLRPSTLAIQATMEWCASAETVLPSDPVYTYQPQRSPSPQPQLKTTFVTSQVSQTVLESERFGDPVMISPLNFPPCPKGRGRPKQKRQGAPASQKRKGTERDTSLPFSFVPSLLQPYLREEPDKKRGRPAGSKNNAKTATLAVSNRTHADPQFETTFYDSVDI